MSRDPKDQIPPDVVDALTDESIEHLMLSLQGPGIMMVDASQEGEVELDRTFDSRGPEPDSEEARVRMADLRYTLGVSGTARPAPPRPPPPPPPPTSTWLGWALVAAVGGLGVLAMLLAAVVLLVAGFA